ncbi:hypothetical protein SLS59_007077 [Nothophoma quercina]|uniref:Uncharacterized protein n=1 Tax=Nothophoma quercina TaxID=749835 RepID=A0ABR3R0X0_9PLEO
MAVFDRQGDVQYERDLLSSCLRGDLLDSDEHQSDRLILVKSRLDVPELMGNDFSYLFSDGDQGIQTKYCYWGDPEKKIRNLHAQNIRGIGGAITRMENLKPIFLLNLNPPTQFAPNDPESPSLRRRSSSVPVQFIFRCFGGSSFWTGCPPLVDVMVAEGEESGPWERTFEGFTYKDERYNTYHRNDTDWVRVAELESRQRCNEIETS